MFIYHWSSCIVRNECKIDDHGNTPCQNGAVCYDHLKDYTCRCKGTYQGINCEEEGKINAILDIHYDVSIPPCDTVPQTEVISPEIRQPPENTMTDLATSVSLTCTAEGHPAPSYEWYKDNVLVPGERRSVLYIPELSPHDRGNYTCKAINSEGGIESQPAKLDIQGRMI